ncbi:MAG: hypothetical protein QHH30_06290 [candidate division NC10 bacterium]|nr:hypothetical protein [candidate division NC10 bacterium]
MKPLHILILIMTITALLGATQALAATATANLSVSATVGSWARLDWPNPASLTFADSDPDNVSSIPASEGPVGVSAKARTGSSDMVTLTVTGTDLTSGGNTIAITNVSWTATGDFSSSGNITTGSQTVKSWTGPGTKRGNFSHALTNSWDYATGTYSGTVTYTLTAP